MNKYIFPFSFFFLLFFNLSFSQFIIKDSIINASIIRYENIHVFNEDSDIVLTGDFLVRNRLNSIWIEPRNGYSITIKPNITLRRPTTVGITDDESRPAPRITIYPNPTSNTITITITTQEEITSLELYDNYGIKQTDPTLEANNMVNLESYASGIYMLKIYLNNSEVLTETIVKQ